MKKIMVLGAGIYQVPLIKKIREKGHTAIVVSPNGPYPGIQLADIHLDVDTRNKVQVLEEAKNLAIDAVLTTGTDVAVPTIGYLVDRLGLTGVNYESAKNSTDKTLMKQCFRNNSVRTAKFAVVKSLNELIDESSKIGFPVIIKAVDSSGSRGITKVSQPSDLKDAFEEAQLVSKSNSVIVEEFLSGYEIGADLFVVGNKVVDIFLHEKLLNISATTTPIGHSMPLNISQELSQEIYRLLEGSVKSLGISDTASNADIMIVNDEPYIIEMSARMGGTCIPEVIGNYVGFNVYEYLIDLSLGNNPKLPDCSSHQPTVAKLIKSSKSGILKSIPNISKIANRQSIVSLQFDAKIGDYVKKFKVGPDRIGHIIVQSSTSNGCMTELSELEKEISFEVTEFE